MIEIPLTRGYTAVIDDEHAELASGYRWRVLVQPHTCYAVARLPRLFGKQRSLYLHRLIVRAGAGGHGRMPHDWIRLSKTTAIEHGVASARCRPFGTGSTRR